MALPRTSFGQHTLTLSNRLLHNPHPGKRHLALLVLACFALDLGALALEHVSSFPVAPWLVAPFVIPLLAGLSLPLWAIALSLVGLGDYLAHLVFVPPEAAWPLALANAFGLLCGLLWWRRQPRGAAEPGGFLKTLTAAALLIPLFSALPTALAALSTGQAPLAAGTVRYLSGALGMLVLLPLMLQSATRRWQGLGEAGLKSRFTALAGLILSADALLLWLAPAQSMGHGVLLSAVALGLGAFRTTLAATLGTLFILTGVTLQISAVSESTAGGVIHQFLLALAMLPAILFALVLRVRRRAHRRLRRKEQAWRDAFKGSGQGVWESDLSRRRLSLSHEVGRLLGSDSGRRPGTLVDIDRMHRAVLARERLSQALTDEKECWRVTLGSIGEAVIVTDRDGSITFMNAAAERLTGWAAGEARGLPCGGVFDLRGADGAPCDPVRSCLAYDGVETVGEELTLCDRTGSNVEIYATVAPVRESDDRLTGAVAVFRDLSRSRDLQRRLNFSLNHDALTGYYNRFWFEQAVARAVGAAARGESAVLGVINMDYFRIVNDAAGHLAGDALLVEVSCLIGRHLAEGDILARLGSDEFGLLLRHCELESAHYRVEGLLADIAALRFRWEGRLYDVSASGGLVAITADTPDFGALMSRADIGCYTAKQQGRNRVNVYRPGQAGVEHLHQEIFMAAGLREAIENDRFRLYGQRIVPLRERQLPEYYEVLIKMHDIRGALVEPGAFIPAAERYGLMSALDRWIIDNVLIRQGEAIAAMLSGRTISINLSASSLGDTNFLPWLLKRLARTPIEHASLLFEITETALMGHLSRAGEVIETLRSMGCRVALDDFGSGFSSFGYLRSFTVDVVKIDGGFIRHIDDNRLDQVIVESVNQVAHRLGALTVAEFVENAETFERLCGMGLDYAQGHYIHRPQPLDELYGPVQSENSARDGSLQTEAAGIGSGHRGFRDADVPGG